MSESGSAFRLTPIDRGLHIEFDVTATRAEGQQKRARFGPFDILCDESALIGGDDSAPPPLAYFAASIAF